MVESLDTSACRVPTMPRHKSANAAIALSRRVFCLNPGTPEARHRDCHRKQHQGDSAIVSYCRFCTVEPSA